MQNLIRSSMRKKGINKKAVFNYGATDLMKSLGFVLALFVLLAGLFVVFKPNPTDSPSVVAPVAAMPAASDALAVTSSANSASISPPASNASSSASPVPVAEVGSASAPKTESPTPTIELLVAKGRLASGPTLVQVKQGDRVRLAVTSDAADELHLHGYNLYLHLQPGQRSLLDFVAAKSGRFTYELHHTDLELGALEVYPR